MEHHVQTLRRVAENLGLPPLKTLLREPTVQAVYRISLHYGDLAAHDSVATLIKRTEPAAPTVERGEIAVITLTVGFHAALGGKLLVHQISSERYNAFVMALRAASFDKLQDQADLPFYGADVWQVERGAGSFIKSVLLAPAQASGAHAAVVAAIRTYLPEALRQVQ